MPLSPEDQRRYDAIKSVQQRIASDRLPQSISDTPGPPAADLAGAARRSQGILARGGPTLDAENAARRSGGTLVDNLPMGVDPGQRVVAQPSRLVGGGIQDGIPRPTFQTGYGVYGADGRQGSMTITGPDRRVGGGTLSAPDQSNGGTVDGNVAGINRQIAALRDLREARNPGITTGQAGRAFGDTVSFGTPGGGFGQEQLDANRSVSFRDLPFGQPGDRAKRRDLLSLMEMQQRGQQFDAQQMGEQEKVAMQQQAGILKGAQEMQQAAANRTWEQAKWGQQFGLDQQKFGLDQQRATTDQQSKQTGILKDLIGLDQERMKQGLFGQYLGAQDEQQQRAALNALLAYQGHPQQDKIVPFDQQIGVDALGKPVHVRSLYDVTRNAVVNTGAGIAGPGAQPAPQPTPQRGQPPPQQDIEYLKANPRAAANFDSKYGKGSAARILGE